MAPPGGQRRTPRNGSAGVPSRAGAPPASARPPLPGKVTPVSWEPHDTLGEREWLALGRHFGQVSRCSQFWLGDWLNYGERRWGKTYAQAARATGYDVRTLRNIAYVAGRVQVSLRNDGLSFTHHALVAPLPPDEQVRWLGFARAERLSVEDLKSAMRSEQRSGDPPPEEPSAEEEEGGALTAPDASEAPPCLTCPHCSGEIPYELIEEEFSLARRRMSAVVR